MCFAFPICNEIHDIHFLFSAGMEHRCANPDCGQIFSTARGRQLHQSRFCCFGGGRGRILGPSNSNHSSRRGRSRQTPIRPAPPLRTIPGVPPLPSPEAGVGSGGGRGGGAGAPSTAHGPSVTGSSSGTGRSDQSTGNSDEPSGETLCFSYEFT